MHRAAALAPLLLALTAPALAQDVEEPQDQPSPAASPEAQPSPAASPEAPQPNAKASLAVLPFTFASETLRKYRDGVVRLAIDQFETSAFTNKFVTALVQTRKFDIVERQRVDKLLDEMQMGESGLQDPARVVQAGKMIGADYVLTGEISVFNIQVEWNEIPNTGRLSRKVTSLIIVDMRIVDTRTSRVVSADKGEVREVEKTLHQQRVPFQMPPDMIDKLQRKLAQKLVIKTIDGVYPIKIISLADGVATLNRGEGGGLDVGQILDVYQVGDEIVDPDTGDSLGFEEHKVGRLQVTDVLQRFSKAQIVETSAPLTKGAICRKAEMAEPAPQPTPRRGPRW